MAEVGELLEVLAEVEEIECLLGKGAQERQWALTIPTECPLGVRAHLPQLVVGPRPGKPKITPVRAPQLGLMALGPLILTMAVVPLMALGREHRHGNPVLELPHLVMHSVPAHERQLMRVVVPTVGHMDLRRLLGGLRRQPRGLVETILGDTRPVLTLALTMLLLQVQLLERQHPAH